LGILASAIFFGGAAFLAGVRLAAFLARVLLATFLAEGFDFFEETLIDGFLAFALTFFAGTFFADVRLDAAADTFFATVFRAADFTGFLAAPFALEAFFTALAATVLRLEIALRVGFCAIRDSCRVNI
jgi:hypothetical protein